MRKLVILIMALTNLIIGCSSDYKYKELQSTDTILIIGDQFTNGYGVSHNFSYPEVLKTLNNKKLKIIAKNGFMVKDLKNTFDEITPDIKLIILMVGYNDISKGTEYSRFYADLNSFLYLTKNKNIPVYLHDMSSGKNNIDIYTELSNAFQNVILDDKLFKYVSVNKDLISAPGELNPDGYRELAEGIDKQLRKDGFVRN